jgi:hypothetical protein
MTYIIVSFSICLYVLCVLKSDKICESMFEMSVKSLTSCSIQAYVLHVLKSYYIGYIIYTFFSLCSVPL